ncbi:MAG: phosphatidylserine synthase [Acidobacteriia bacterium]|nr:phosphatidylserine synthase [Terriglobia bacterium]
MQPDDGIIPLIKGITRARKSVEIVIFRFDQREIERALANAVSRGVFVHALIAHTNRAGEEGLRKLEMRLLAQGVTVARTADDLVRYHDKMIIIDRRELYLLAFNFTHLDIEHSRSFGVITRSRSLVREAVKLFEADTMRHPYEPGLARFVVSPLNARKQLAAFIKGAKKELLIYDPKISDPAMIRLLEERAKAGVDVRVIGKLTRKSSGLAARKLSQIRLHTRTMVRDHRLVFVGSQSLREMELDARREVGLILCDARVVSRLVQIFQEDWETAAQSAASAAEEPEPAGRVARKVAKILSRDMPPVAPVLEQAVRELAGDRTGVEVDPKELEGAVREAVKEAVREAVEDVVEEAVEQAGGKGA